MPKTTEQNLTVCVSQPEAQVTDNKRLRSMHKASCGLSATAELLVLFLVFFRSWVWSSLPVQLIALKDLSAPVLSGMLTYLLRCVFFRFFLSVNVLMWDVFFKVFWFVNVAVYLCLSAMCQPTCHTLTTCHAVGRSCFIKASSGVLHWPSCRMDGLTSGGWTSASWL